MVRCALSLLVLVVVSACARDGGDRPVVDSGTDGGATSDAGVRDAHVGPIDLGPLDPDAACATSTASATVHRLPVDIIWVIDNSSSMAPAIAAVQSGMNSFTDLVTASDLDYRVIVVSKRAPGTYGICIPPPLSSDTRCSDGPRFFHESVAIRSVQGMEQALGTLDETSGYAPGESYGADLGETSWGTHLRPEATKTIVMVTDDNERMVTSSFGAPARGDADPAASPAATVDWFEHKTAGLNPFNGSGGSTRALPVGLLDPSRGGLFDGYLFDAIYGYGSETDDTVICSYASGPRPPASGRTYTAWTSGTAGVRARICDSGGWPAFFGDVATAVVESSRISCSVDLPAPPDGTMLDPTRVNVDVVGGTGTTMLSRTTSAATCGTSEAWYYDDPAMPTQVVLCPAACDRAQMELTTGGTSGVNVSFGCMSRLI